jgi:hypothetical protein
MHLEFCHPEYQTPIVTSRIQEVRERIHRGSSQVTADEPATAPGMFTRGTFAKPASFTKPS